MKMRKLLPTVLLVIMLSWSCEAGAGDVLDQYDLVAIAKDEKQFQRVSECLALDVPCDGLQGLKGLFLTDYGRPEDFSWFSVVIALEIVSDSLNFIVFGTPELSIERITICLGRDLKDIFKIKSYDFLDLVQV